MSLLEQLNIDPEDLSPLDRAFGAFIGRLAEQHADKLTELTTVLSYHVSSGHTLLPLNILPDCAEWQSYLRNSPQVVTETPEQAPLVPLVLTKDAQLYLHKYYNYEQEIAQRLVNLAQHPLHCPALKADELTQLFSNYREAILPGGDGVNYQKMAVYNALCRDLAVITGGPGTGKTTVAAVLLGLELERNPHLKIQLCTPTGKATARLREAIDEEQQKLPFDAAIKQKLTALPSATIHKLLKINPQTGECTYNAANPLDCELMLIDECSMVSLTLFTHLLRALPPHCRLVLLGDRHQLASVESGAIFGDICESAPVNAFAPEVAANFQKLTAMQPQINNSPLPLSGVVAELLVSQRFASAPGIGVVANAIRRPDSSSAQFIWSYQSPEISCHPLKELNNLGNYLAPWRQMVQAAQIGTPEAIKTAFQEQNKLQILTVGHHGNYGTKKLNKKIAQLLGLKDFNTAGTPVLVTVNHNKTGLKNGDLGLITINQAGEKRIRFPQFETDFSPATMPPFEPNWAMTTHKSQGSGFDRVILVLPSQETPILTRELLYTGITRARQEVVIFGTEKQLKYALEHPTRRDSGLRDRLKR